MLWSRIVDSSTTAFVPLSAFRGERPYLDSKSQKASEDNFGPHCTILKCKIQLNLGDSAYYWAYYSTYLAFYLAFYSDYYSTNYSVNYKDYDLLTIKVFAQLIAEFFAF